MKLHELSTNISSSSSSNTLGTGSAKAIKRMNRDILHARYGLECKICINTYRMYFVEGGEDYLRMKHAGHRRTVRKSRVGLDQCALLKSNSVKKKVNSKTISLQQEEEEQDEEGKQSDEEKHDESNESSEGESGSSQSSGGESSSSQSNGEESCSSESSEESSQESSEEMIDHQSMDDELSSTDNEREEAEKTEQTEGTEGQDSMEE